MSTPAVRVVSLSASNILRLSAVEFTWEEGKRVLTLGGKNGAGKSSVLHAVAMALGGMALCPDQPLKDGEMRGFVSLNLGELVVRREFWRDLLTVQSADGPPAFGEVKSRLIVKNADGIKQEPAQRVLDKLIGKLSFDPMAFASEDADKQAEILRKIVGLNFTDLDEARRIAYETRAIHTKTAKEQLVILDAMPKYEDVPAEEVSSAALLQQLNDADDLRKAAGKAEQAAAAAALNRDRARIATEHAWRLTTEIEQRIVDLQKTLESTIADAKEADVIRVKSEEGVETATRIAAAHLEKIPDTSAIQAQIAAVEDTNAKVRANIARQNVMNTVVKYQNLSATEDAKVEKYDDDKAATLRAAKFPIPGLAISHAGVVTFNGVTFKQSSTAEQIRVSVAIGFALNPALKLLCIKNGNALDDDSFKLIADAAEKEGGQILMEIVTKNKDDVSVFIEDGHS